MSRELDKFAAYLKLADQMIDGASKSQVAEAARVLAIELAHYRTQFGEVSASYETDATGSISDEQASKMADGCEVLIRTMFILGSPPEPLH